MIAQNNMIEMDYKLSPLAQPASKTAEKLKDKGFPLFGDLLSKAQSNSGPKQINNAAVKKEAAPRFVSFREASARQAVKEQSKAAPGKGGLKDNDNISGANQADQQERADAAMELIAGFFAVSKGELAAVLEKAGVDPVSLTDKAAMDGNLNKLSEFLTLNSEQKAVLGELLKTVSVKLGGPVLKSELKAEVPTVKENEATTPKADVASQAAPEQTNAVKISQTKQLPEAKPDFAQALGKLREKLDQLAGKFKKAPEEMKAEIAENLDEIADTKVMPNTVSTPKKLEPSKHDTSAVDPGADDLKAPVSEKKDINGEAGSDSSDSEKELWPEAGKGGGLSTNKEDKPGAAFKAEFPQISAQTTEQPKEPGKPELPRELETVNKIDILPQIIEKAKVFIDGKKAEMSMDLKPDNLGKLTLKIITEHGIVTARFVAESLQVKQVLEANMQTLKDSLEKQGMSFESYSVSVGENGTNERQTSRDTGKERYTGNTGTITGQHRPVTALGGIGPETGYRWEPESKINLTA